MYRNDLSYISETFSWKNQQEIICVNDSRLIINGLHTIRFYRFKPNTKNWTSGAFNLTVQAAFL